MDHEPVTQLVIVLALATVLVAVFLKLRLSPILGYLVTGVLIGPSVLGWLEEGPTLRLLAELGVVLLMFTIGLEFSLSRFLAARRLALGLGGSQFTVTGVVFAVAAWAWWSLPAVQALVVGGALAMSSTAVVLKQLGEQMELSTPHGRTATGILLFQDVAAVALLAALPILAADSGTLGGALGLALAKAAVVFIALALIGHRLLPPLLYWVGGTRSLELFMLTALLLALAAAALSAIGGLPATLGAFMAGMLLGETPLRHQLEASIAPFRDLMLGLFFATVGMRLDPATFLAMPTTVLAIVVALVIGKALVAAPLLRAAGQPAVEASRAAISLAQGGELGLLVVTSSLTLGVLEASVAQPLLAGLILSMAFAPILLRFNESVAARLSRLRAPRGACNAEAQVAEASGGLEGHVIVCGYGRLGQNLVRLLSQEGIPALALDTDAGRVRQAAAAGERVAFGNALQPGVLRAAGIDRARALAVTIKDAGCAARILQLARNLDHELPILARSTRAGDEETLAAAGGTVFPEGLETSLAFTGQLLIMLGIPPSRVEARLSAVRAGDYVSLRAFFHDSLDEGKAAEARDYPEGLRALVVGDRHHAAGRTLQEVDLNGAGVELLDVRRGAIRVPGRLLDTRLRAGDVLLIKGRPEALDGAIARLTEGP